MGVVRRQGIKQSIVTYIGILIGAISTFFIYPLVEESYGYIQFIISAAMIAVPFTMFGTTSVMIRFFPEFKDENVSHNGLLSILSLAVLFGFIIFLIFLFAFEPLIYKYYADKPQEYLAYLPFTIPLVLFISYSNLLQRYIFNFKRIVVPAIYSNLVPKIVLPILMLAVLYDLISLKTALIFFVLMWLFINLGLLFYIWQLKQWHFGFNFKFITTERFRRMFNFGVYGLFGGWGFVLSSQIDIFMVGFITANASAITVYAICSFMANFIDVPRKAITNIASPLISQAWADNDLKYLNDLYRSTSITQYVVGLGLFLLIWLSVDDVFSFMSNGEAFRAGKYVVFFLGLSKVIDMVTGVNNSIIGLSKYYRFNLILTLVLAVTNIANNWLLIPIYGITGAAIATLISIVLFNLCKFGFLFFKFKMQPFTIDTLWITLIGLVSYYTIYYLPISTSIPFIDLIIRSTFFVIIFGSMVYYFKVSKEINDLIDNTFDKIVSLIK